MLCNPILDYNGHQKNEFKKVETGNSRCNQPRTQKNCLEYENKVKQQLVRKKDLLLEIKVGHIKNTPYIYTHI